MKIQKKANEVMSELVYRKENQALTNSRLVAMKFSKRHSDIIRAIEELLSKLPENERERNFAQLEEDVEIPNGGSKKMKGNITINLCNVI